MAVDAELQDAINSAAEEITGKTVDEITGEKPSEKTEETVETDDEITETQEDDELDDAQKAEAILLYKKLKDPTEGVAIVAALAQRAGLLQDRPLETKKEVAVAKKDILTIFEEELGPSMKFLAPQLSKAVDKVLAQERESQQAELNEVRTQQALGVVNKTLDSLAKETNGQSRQFENQMAKLMDEYPMAPNGDPEKYIRDMFALASAGKVKNVVSKQLSDKVRRNANNVADRLGNRNGASQGETLPSKKMNLTESIRYAQQILEKRK